MRAGSFLPFIILPFFLFFFSCDEFLLKKTVSVNAINGQIQYDDQTPRLWGEVNYKIKNPQSNPLKEIYLICHTHVEMDSISYNKKPARFEVGEGFGDRVYRVFIPSLSPQEKAELSIKFHVSGQFQEERLLMNKNEVFFDVRKIWLPVPFADRFDFPYELSITTPDRFYSIMGGKNLEEKVINHLRTITWKSELESALSTGTLLILPFNRTQYKNIDYFSDTTNNQDLILQYSRFSNRLLKKAYSALPITQFHVVKRMYPYSKMQEIIDGEYLANMILLSPEMCDYTPMITTDTLSRSVLPFVPNTSEVKLFEVIAHEFSHSLISTLLHFEEDYHISMEALTEFTACSILNSWDPVFKEKILERNRILLINLQLQNEQKNNIWKYFYQSNLLNACFWLKDDIYMDYIQILIEKYRFTEIQWPQLISTAQDLNRVLIKDQETNQSPFWINTVLMENWDRDEMYNLSLSSTEVMFTNHNAPTWKKIQPRRSIKIKNHFPFDIDAILIVFTPTNTYSNLIIQQNDGETNILVGMDTITVLLESRYSTLETHLADNQLNFADHSWLDLVNEINHYYRDETHNTRFLIITPEWSEDIQKQGDSRWLSLNDDRTLSQNISPQVFFQYDKVFFDKKEFYIEAYKWINNRPYSYVVFKGKILKNKLQVDAILDPTL